MKILVEKSITIDSSVDKVYTCLVDFKQWNMWSPWMYCEPTAKQSIEGKPGAEGHFQTWDGEVIGSGKTTLEKLEKNKLVRTKLEFYKPWKSLASACFTLNSLGEQKTTVTWTMDSSLPFFMFFFKKMMIAYIGSDFSRGLTMLKEYVETGKVVTKSVYLGEKQLPGFQLVGKVTSCTIDEMPERMKQDFERMDKTISKGELVTPKAAASMYRKYDIPGGKCEYISGFVYDESAKIKAPSDCSIYKFGAHKALSIDHFGPYKHLGNGWSMAISYQRGKKKKLIKSFPMYETYVSMPGQVDEKDIHTQIMVPIK